MSKFTASNGVEIGVGKDFSGDTYLTGKAGECIVATGNMEGIGALREFFQHERDQELGRWRWPEDQNFVVYSRGDERVRVVNEATGDMRRFERAVWSSDTPFREAAKDYFAAHPAPKPWHDAKPGEVWELTYGGCPTAHVFTNQHSKHPGFAFVADRAIVNPDDPDITSGRRIWPEA